MKFWLFSPLVARASSRDTGLTIATTVFLLMLRGTHRGALIAMVGIPLR